MNNCQNCGAEIPKRNKFCSIKCQKNYEYNTYIYKWKQGDVNGLRGKYQLSMHIREYMLEKYNNKCAICGWSRINPYTNNVPLEIEHIDGNYLNNNEDNLIVLCPNCHSLTSTYKGANMKHGRKERNKYN